MVDDEEFQNDCVWTRCHSIIGLTLDRDFGRDWGHPLPPISLGSKDVRCKPRFLLRSSATVVTIAIGCQSLCPAAEPTRGLYTIKTFTPCAPFSGRNRQARSTEAYLQGRPAAATGGRTGSASPGVPGPSIQARDSLSWKHRGSLRRLGGGTCKSCHTCRSLSEGSKHTPSRPERKETTVTEKRLFQGRNRKIRGIQGSVWNERLQTLQLVPYLQVSAQWSCTPISSSCTWLWGSPCLGLDFKSAGLGWRGFGNLASSARCRTCEALFEAGAHTTSPRARRQYEARAVSHLNRD
jgi:hypothetical protein